jgi:ABC-type multidrug transport system fused ATPase/permease subunit
VIWLSWRQQRTEVLIAALVFAIVSAVLVPTGLHIASVYDGQSLGACLRHPTDACRDTLDTFQNRWDPVVNIVVWFNLVPAVIGMLLATPLVLEFERGTYRLAWTQSVTRGRWLTIRLALIGVGAALSALVLTALMTWWRGPLDDVGSRLQDGFDFEGLAPTAYTLFAAALVLAIGAVLRRTGTAIGIAFVAFFVIRIGIEGWVRQHFQAAVHKTWTSGDGPDLRGAWILSQLRGLRVAQGYPNDRGIIDSCVNTSTKGIDRACLAQHHVIEYGSAVFHPANRFWLFQGIEAGIFGALTAALVLFSIWWIRKRIT